MNQSRSCLCALAWVISDATVALKGYSNKVQLNVAQANRVSTLQLVTRRYHAVVYMRP